MLQIIGWLGCVYLVVKALEIAGNKNYRADDGILTGPAIFAVIVAWAAAAAFALWFLVQGSAMSRIP